MGQHRKNTSAFDWARSTSAPETFLALTGDPILHNQIAKTQTALGQKNYAAWGYELNRAVRYL